MNPVIYHVESQFKRWGEILFATYNIDFAKVGNSYCCKYILQKGKNTGNMCGKPSGSKEYCSKHLPSEEDSKLEVVRKNNLEIRLAKNEYGNYEHVTTNLIFCKEKRCVIGKQVGANVFNLRHEDIEICDKFGFKYDEGCVEPPESDKIGPEEKEVVM